MYRVAFDLALEAAFSFIFWLFICSYVSIQSGRIEFTLFDLLLDYSTFCELSSLASL